jgi:hypothetical protein
MKSLKKRDLAILPMKKLKELVTINGPMEVADSGMQLSLIPEKIGFPDHSRLWKRIKKPQTPAHVLVREDREGKGY